jgi:hypothetical protein
VVGIKKDFTGKRVPEQETLDSGFLKLFDFEIVGFDLWTETNA